MRSILLFALMFAFATPVQAEFRGKARFSDGDTFSFRVRLSGIDTPEKAQKCKDSNGACYACGEASLQAAEKLVGDKLVNCKPTGAVTYGRVVAACFVDGKDYQEEMVRQGWAFVYKQYVDGSVRDRYLAAEKEARDAKRGVWQGEHKKPWDWRNKDARVEGCE